MLKILIVDDDPSLADLFSSLFTRYGCEVSSYCSAEAAIGSARAFAPDVLLCDLHVRSSSGFDVARQVSELVPGCRTVLISGADTVPIAEQNPSFRILQKPVGVKELLRAVGLDELQRAVNE